MKWMCTKHVSQNVQGVNDKMRTAKCSNQRQKYTNLWQTERHSDHQNEGHSERQKEGQDDRLKKERQTERQITDQKTERE